MSSTANSLINKTNEIIKLGGVSTHILKYGSLPSNNKDKNSEKFLFLVIPGMCNKFYLDIYYVLLPVSWVDRWGDIINPSFN